MRSKTFNKLGKTLTALLLALALTFGQGSALFMSAGQVTAQAAETTSAGESTAQVTTLTRAQARDIIFAAASKYRDGLKLTDVMSGYEDGSLRENNPVTRIEAMVMISRAFGALPEPGNDWARISTVMITDPETGEEYPSEAAVFDDVPSWAVGAYNNLWAGHIFAPTDEPLKGKEFVPAAELDTLLHRVYALYGTRLEDDFFAAVNKEWLDNSVLPEYGASDSAFKQAERAADKRVDEIVASLLNDKWDKGTTERKIADVYRAYIDIDAQAKSGAKPLKPYLDKLAAANDMNGLIDALSELAEVAAFFPFLTFEFMPDYKDSTVNVIYLGANMPQVVMADSSEMTMTAYTARMFELAGFPNPAESAKAALSVETAIMDATYSVEESESMQLEDHVTRYTTADLQKMFTGTDAKKLLTMGGLKESPVYIAYGAGGVEALKTLGKLFTADNIAALRAYAAYKLLDNYHMSMGADFLNAYEYATGSEPRTFSAEAEARYAKLHIKDLFSGYISETYAARYFSAEDKAAVTDMIHTFIENYKGRIANIGWLSDATKKMALKKLDTMVVKVGWTDKPDAFTHGLEIVSIEDGGSLVGNLMTIERRKLALNIDAQGKPVDREKWQMPAYETNYMKSTGS